MSDHRVIRVLLADDHPVVRAGIRAIVENTPDLQVVGEASDGLEARRLTADLSPDVLLLDLHMRGPRPPETVAWVRANYPQTAVLILTAHDVNSYLAAMISAGAAGFVVKEEAPETIAGAIRRAARGEVLFGSEQLVRARRWREEVGEPWESLTKREREVVQLLGEGLDNKSIANALCVTQKTVEYHLTNILGKLGVTSRLEAVVWVHDHLPNIPNDDQE
jgi:DNA-binding NarL/FixJ family response regulator